MKIKRKHLFTVLFVMAAAAGQAVAAAEHIVRVVTDNENGMVAFLPGSLQIEPGDTVTWVNSSDDLHNVITYPDGFPEGSNGFESPYLENEGDRWSYTFRDAGTFRYHCIPHALMNMRGVVTVGRPTPQAGFHRPSKTEIAAYRDRLLEFFDSEDFDIMPDAVRRNVGRNVGR